MESIRLSWSRAFGWGLSVIGIISLSACSEDLPPPKNCDCPAPCVIKIVHPDNLSAFDLGRDIEIKDYDNGTQYVYHQSYPGKDFPPVSPEYISVPCCKRLSISIGYVAGCVPGSPYYGQIYYTFTADISPQACTTEVKSDPVYFFNTCN